ncbi:hypothetical protein Ahy_A05g025242 [Arachis hypogaea]|uniref:BED-type domain-containing protein n=1 Tax=Arachis hypogaea TaxID=3818 RepID=A0A445D893_ARAHY|nr:hypothetical protein Ahy_A05g025242 [Arachis hypogaea]
MFWRTLNQRDPSRVALRLALHRRRQTQVLSTAASSSSPCPEPNNSTVMDNSINQEAIADNNASVNNNLPVDPPISNDATNPNPPSANDSQSQGSSNLRKKTDLAWKYVALQIVNEKPQYQCLFCLQVFNGGGIHRMKKHLAKITGDVKKCPKVSYDVEKQMKNLLKEIQTNKNKRKVSFSEEGGDECNNLDSVDAMKEIHLYRDQKESFDKPEAIRAASQLKPGEIDADLYQSGGGSSGGHEGEDNPTEVDLQQVLADFDD